MEKNRDFRLVVEMRSQQLEVRGRWAEKVVLGKTLPPGATLLDGTSFTTEQKENFRDCFVSGLVSSTANGIPSWGEEALRAVGGSDQGCF